MATLKQAALLISFFTLAQSQFVPAPTDLQETKGFLDIPVRYKEVPDGICETTPGVKSYSGYVDVEENQHYFWWFFETRGGDPTTAPLTVWINGGPGSSSMIGLFQENGPCGVDFKGDLYYNPYSWNNVSNMLYIDNPAQVGFSYSIPVPGFIGLAGDIVTLPDNTCPSYGKECATYSYPSVEDTANSTIDAASGMWRTLQGFMGAMPQYSRHGFNFATESYGGHYGPVFNEYIETQNTLIAAGKLPGAHHIELETVTIGNGWYDPLIQYAAYYNYSVENTYFQPLNKTQLDQQYLAMYGEGNCYDMTVQCYETGRDDVCESADNFCYGEVEIVLDVYSGRDEYDIRELTPDPFPYSFYPKYLNKPEVQQAIGAFVNFSDYNSDAISFAFGNTGDDDRTEGAVKDCQKLVEQGVYLVQYNGDADYICNWIGNQAVVEEINAPGMSSAGFENISTSDGIVHGQVKQSANFAFARIYESGHEVPFYQPVVALEMFDRAINGKNIATGEERVSKGCGYKTTGSSKSTYYEGKATVQHKVLPKHATYNTTTNEPNPFNKTHTRRSLDGVEKRSRRLVKPMRGRK